MIVSSTLCALLHSVTDLKTAQMNMQRNLIWELTLYGFELGYNSAEATKNTCCTKGEGAVDRSRVMRRFEKFRSEVCKDLDDEIRPRKSKSVHSEALLKAIETNLVSCVLRVSDELCAT